MTPRPMQHIMSPPDPTMGRQEVEDPAAGTDGGAGHPRRDGTEPRSTAERLDRIEALLAALVERESVKDWYSTAEFARLVGKAEFTCREWCRLGRIRAEKRRSGRGAYPAWVISHDELLRYRRDGLIPPGRPA